MEKIKARHYRMNSDELKKNQKRLTRKTISEITRPSTIVKPLSTNLSVQNSPISNSSKIQHFIRNSPKSRQSHSKTDSLTNSNQNTSRKTFSFDCAIRNYFHQSDNNIGRILENRYKVVDKLGEGGFSKVYKVLVTDTQEYLALKISNKDFRAKRSAQNEIKLLSKYKGHNFIAQIKDEFVYEGSRCIVQELYESNLYTILSKTGHQGLPIRIIKQIARQILSVLSLFSEDDLCHADLKPENILISNTQTMQIKVSDFGCGFYGKLTNPGYIQSRFYRAPEIILESSCDLSIDMWSLGCLLSELYTGEPLFSGHNTQDQLQKIISFIGQPPAELLQHCPEDLKKVSESFHQHKALQTEIPIPLFSDFVSECLKYTDRITPQKALLHPWLNS